MPAFVNALNRVDFPTLGRPTIPHFKLMAVPENQAGKCMRWHLREARAALRRGMLGALLLLCAAGAAAAVQSAQSPALLTDEQMTIDAQELGLAWVDAAGTATL